MSTIRIGVYAGSFDPFTTGHAHIVGRALAVVDELHIVIGQNILKQPFQLLPERLQQLKQLYKEDPRIIITTHEGIIAQYAHEHDALLIRGLRTVADLETERTLAEVNKAHFGVETICLFAESRFSYVSSSLVRELAAFGEDYSDYIPNREQRYGY